MSGKILLVDDSGLARALYSSDASLYRVVPQAVVRPRDVDEIPAVLEVCRSLGVPLTARGAAPPAHVSVHAAAPAQSTLHVAVQAIVHVAPSAQRTVLLAPPTTTSHCAPAEHSTLLLAPIGFVGSTPLVFNAYPGLGLKSLKDLVEMAKKKNGALTYGSVGPGSLPHLSTELFARAAGVKMTHVPYKGGAPAVRIHHLIPGAEAASRAEGRGGDQLSADHLPAGRQGRRRRGRAGTRR